MVLEPAARSRTQRGLQACDLSWAQLEARARCPKSGCCNTAPHSAGPAGFNKHGVPGVKVWHSMSCCSLLSRASCLQDSMPSIQTCRLLILQPFKSVA